MARIVFITSRYLPSPDANGICVHQIIEQLKSEGHKIICICSQEEGQTKIEQIGDVEIIRVKRSYFAYLLDKSRDKGNKNMFVLFLLLIRRVRLFLSIPIFPNIEPARSRKILKLVESKVKENSIDCIIGVFRPFEGVNVAQKIKKTYPEIVCGAYYLDLLKGATIPKIFPVSLYNVLCDKSELKAFKNLDFVMMAESGKKIYSTPYFDRVLGKIHYINFPLFRDISNESYSNITYDEEYFNIVYAGYLDSGYRNPRYIFEVIKNLIEDGIKVKMHIYGRNNCMNIINEFCQEHPNHFYYYGAVESDKAKGAILAADAVLNVSNKNDSIVPSKIFEIFSSCRPIISVISNPNDPSLTYLNQYPCSHIVNEYDGKVKNDEVKLLSFIGKSKSSNITFKEIEPLFFSSTPVATTKIIEKYLGEVMEVQDD